GHSLRDQDEVVVVAGIRRGDGGAVVTRPTLRHQERRTAHPQREGAVEGLGKDVRFVLVGGGGAVIVQDDPIPHSVPTLVALPPFEVPRGTRVGSGGATAGRGGGGAPVPRRIPRGRQDRLPVHPAQERLARLDSRFRVVERLLLPPVVGGDAELGGRAGGQRQPQEGE